VFKYHLNGTLAMFEVLDGILTQKQIDWLFKKGNFAYHEDKVKEWIKLLKANFEITVGDPVLDFESLWNLYDLKVKKHEAVKSFTKLKEADIIKCFFAVPQYKKYIARKNIAQAHLSTFINQRYFEDEWQNAK
jgi:hypothetical protein